MTSMDETWNQKSYNKWVIQQRRKEPNNPEHRFWCDSNIDTFWDQNVTEAFLFMEYVFLITRNRGKVAVHDGRPHAQLCERSVRLHFVDFKDFKETKDPRMTQITLSKEVWKSNFRQYGQMKGSEEKCGAKRIWKWTGQKLTGSKRFLKLGCGKILRCCGDKPPNEFYGQQSLPAVRKWKRAWRLIHQPEFEDALFLQEQLFMQIKQKCFLQDRSLLKLQMLLLQWMLLFLFLLLLILLRLLLNPGPVGPAPLVLEFLKHQFLKDQFLKHQFPKKLNQWILWSNHETETWRLMWCCRILAQVTRAPAVHCLDNIHVFIFL